MAVHQHGLFASPSGPSGMLSRGSSPHRVVHRGRSFVAHHLAEWGIGDALSWLIASPSGASGTLSRGSSPRRVVRRGRHVGDAISRPDASLSGRVRYLGLAPVRRSLNRGGLRPRLRGARRPRLFSALRTGLRGGLRPRLCDDRLHGSSRWSPTTSSRCSPARIFARLSGPIFAVLADHIFAVVSDHVFAMIACTGLR